jgi:hypothetical protein
MTIFSHASFCTDMSARLGMRGRNSKDESDGTWEAVERLPPPKPLVLLHANRHSVAALVACVTQQQPAVAQ